MTFSVKIWRLIILKVTKMQRFVLSVEKNTFQKTTGCQGGGGGGGGGGERSF